MYDKVKMWKVGNFDEVIERLDNTVIICREKTGEVSKRIGYINNLKIEVKANSISIDGSLAKFLYGNNIKTLDREDTEKAINKLSKRLGINVNEANISELEFGTNFEMKEPVSMYLNKLSPLARFDKNKVKNQTVYYYSLGRVKGAKGGKNNKVLAFYDKGEEVRCKKGLINDLHDKHLLRFEVRYNGRIDRQLKHKGVKAKTLYDPTFYQKMIDTYKDSYKMIPKSKEAEIITNSINSPKDVKNLITSKYLTETKSVNEVMKDIKAINLFKDPKQYTRTKKMLNAVQWANFKPKECSLIQELDSHINSLSK